MPRDLADCVASIGREGHPVETEVVVPISALRTRAGRAATKSANRSVSEPPRRLLEALELRGASISNRPLRAPRPCVGMEPVTCVAGG